MINNVLLSAARRLMLHDDGTSHVRLAWNESDWVGPIGFMLAATPAAAKLPPRFEPFSGSDDLGAYRALNLAWDDLAIPVRSTVRAYDNLPLLVFRLEASDHIAGLATGKFEQPSVSWPAFQPRERMAGGVPTGTRSYGHQYCEFALPLIGDANCNGFLLAPHRPAVVMPLMFIAPDGRTLLIAPLDQFHEQAIAVARDGAGVRCGWHGDLNDVPSGFATEMAIWAGDGPRALLDEWARLLCRRHGTQRLSRYADDLLGKLSYWTDNGSVYYYRTEPDCDYTQTLTRVVGDLHARDIPVRSVQLDSWFYPHQNLRPVSAEGAPMVPPSGMMTWEPRGDLFPDGMIDLSRTLGLPLTLHSRHFSSRSPYFERHAAWRDREYAHPENGELYDLLMEQAASLGAITYEQDWMVESFLGVRGLRERPDRARAWQQHLDRAAGEHGLHLQWCMATPADFMETVTLRNVASIRTSGDYRYLFDNGLNWVWFLHTNALARAFGLNPFKDVFLSHEKTNLSTGEPYAEVEALLSALSAGPVGIGDQLGCSNRELIMRTCREDGILVKPDLPIAAIDRCFRANAFFELAPLIGETHSAHPAGRWIYVATFNASRVKQPLRCRVELSNLGVMQPSGPVIAYDWRRRTYSRIERDGGWDLELTFQDWDFHVLCPILPGDITVFGDVTKYATAGDRRIAHITCSDNGVSFDVFGAPYKFVDIRGYSADRPSTVTAELIGQRRTLNPTNTASTDRDEGWTWDAASGLWSVRVRIGPAGSIQVRIRQR
ncbi:MAG TPA: hypothetical protein VMU16_03110 [Candidatus Binataceae bacterium]|nr:hypothetical protein [Candidatus Binataceae bacterium]